MKTIEIEITKEVKEEKKEMVTLELPIYFRDGYNKSVYHVILSEKGGVLVDTWQGMERISAFTFNNVHYTGKSEIISRQEFMRVFEMVSNDLRSIL